jgi:hypothetical protein
MLLSYIHEEEGTILMGVSNVIHDINNWGGGGHRVFSFRAKVSPP